jgi:hypothetical protein
MPPEALGAMAIVPPIPITETRGQPASPELKLVVTMR